MRQCLTSPEGGYYTQKNNGKDQFGQKGDFITSPEISQVFGELLGVWLVAEWMTQGKISKGVEIIEVGPGRGTLMNDMLRVWYGSIVKPDELKKLRPEPDRQQVQALGLDPALRETQRQLLCGDAQTEDIDIGFRSKSKYGQIPVTWCEDIRLVPSDPTKTPFIFAHEFFDALPIHAFQSVPPNPAMSPPQRTLETPTGPISLSKPSPQSQKPSWRELVVTPTAPSQNQRTPNSTKPPLDFQLSLAKASTPPSLFLPTLSERYKALLPTPGATIEISPESHSYAEDFARRIGGGGASPSAPSKGAPSSSSSSSPTQTTNPTAQPPLELTPNPSGAALIIDYGPLSTVPISSLRGIRAHSPVSPFESPGLVDLSADVDFTALAEAALKASPRVEVHGPVEQGAWLEAMGIRARAEMIVKGMDVGEGGGEEGDGGGGEVGGEGGGGMGRLYKVMAIVPERGGGGRWGLGGGWNDDTKMEIGLRLGLSLSINVVIVPNQGHVDQYVPRNWTLTFHQVAEHARKQTYCANR
ncbi:MAG: hypothetical protein OHK93_004158 [Ramalina farinacea]|uniref:Protein arginine methyltransferase NDUFAF7 n=1 Tax=Ramalina farinacea TaxID=258253 RepID=A0AA43TSF7_9LECA|nr:hypothetical protein [Ramalina farinacea]